MLRSRTHTEVFLCVCFGARRRVTPHVTPWHALDKLRRQPDELGRAKPQLRGQRLVLRLLGDHRVSEAYECDYKAYHKASLAGSSPPQQICRG